MLSKSLLDRMIDRYSTERGVLAVISAPTAAGKTTVVENLVERRPSSVRSISYTSRDPRPLEKDGKDYFFVTEAKFRKLKTKKFFLEWKLVHGRYYGTPKDYVLDNLKKNRDVLLTIDVKGAKEVKRIYKEAVLIFLVPPSMHDILRRLNKRGTESKTEIKKRLKTADFEIKHIPDYDYIVINDRVDNAVTAINAILEAEKKRIRK